MSNAQTATTILQELVNSHRYRSMYAAKREFHEYLLQQPLVFTPRSEDWQAHLRGEYPQDATEAWMSWFEGHEQVRMHAETFVRARRRMVA